MLNVLLIEDEEGGRVLFQRVLQHVEKNYSFFHTNNVDDSFSFFEDIDKTPDIVFLDLNLPNKNGWYFLEELTRRYPNNDVKVFILTSSVNEEDVFLSNKFYQVKGYYSKPITIEKMKQMNAHIQEILK